MAIGSPPTSRHVELDSARNLRDLGGYQGRAGQTLRWQRLYRSDDLSRASDADQARLASLGIATIIDLRTDAERAVARPPGLLGGVSVEVHHLPMALDGRSRWEDVDRLPRVGGFQAADLLARRSLGMLVDGAPAIADAMRILAQPGAQPAIIQSTLGKDRAGLVAAVVLAVLGVATATIAEDCARSDAVVTSDAAARVVNGPEGGGPPWEPPSGLLAAPPQAIVRVLDQVNQRCGSMVGFARGIGVEFEVIEALHRQLLV